MFVPAVYAEPESNPNFPTRDEVEMWLGDLEDSIFEYIDGLPDFQGVLDDLASRVGMLEGLMDDLSARVGENEEDIEELQATSSGGLSVITFGINQLRPFVADWIYVGDYSTMIIHLDGSPYIGNYFIDYTDDPSGPAYTEQEEVICSGLSSCPLAQVEILGDYYRIRDDYPSGRITASGILQ